MKLDEKQIGYIDNYLQFIEVKFLDVRLELIDHLASEFENQSEYVLLGDFLRNKKEFVRAYEKNLGRKKYFGYQKVLIKRIVMFFTSPSYLIYSIMTGLLVFLSTEFLSELFLKIVFITSLIVPQVILYYIYHKPKKMHKKIQSAKYILSIMSLPSIFLYISFPFFEFQNDTNFMLFWFIALIFNAAGILEVIKCKNLIVKAYQNLIKT